MYVLNFLIDLSTLAQLQTEAERKFSKVLSNFLGSERAL
jgi:hypothetical protein